jgi:hypothetical protein
MYSCVSDSEKKPIPLTEVLNLLLLLQYFCGCGGKGDPHTGLASKDQSETHPSHRQLNEARCHLTTCKKAGRRLPDNAHSISGWKYDDVQVPCDCELEVSDLLPLASASELIDPVLWLYPLGERTRAWH